MIFLLLKLIISYSLIQKIIEKTQLLNETIDFYIANKDNITAYDNNMLKNIKLSNDLLIKFIIEKVKKNKILLKRVVLRNIKNHFSGTLIDFTKIFSKNPITDSSLKKQIVEKISLYQYIKIDAFTFLDKLYIRNRYVDLIEARHTIFILLLNIYRKYDQDMYPYKCVDNAMSSLCSFVSDNLSIINTEISNGKSYLDTYTVPYCEFIYLFKKISESKN